MARHDSSEPVEITDRLLWRDAQQMLHRHSERGTDGRCGWCGWQWPCPPRRLAERAEAACRRQCQDSWPQRRDYGGAGSGPGPAGAAPSRARHRRNSRHFH